MLLRPILLVAAACYRVAYKLHHCLCLRPGKPLAHAQLIVVGSFMAGGAGKTPFTAWLAQFILENARIAILCHSKAQDEAEMLRQQFAGLPQVHIIATSNRYTTAHEIDRDYDYIICDDGFEDTRLVNAFTIRLDWDEPPAHIADLLPAGKNRSLLQDHDEPAIRVRPATAPRCRCRLRDRQSRTLPRRPRRLRDFARGVRRATRPRQPFRTNYKHIDIPKKIRHHHGQRHRAPPPRPPRPSRHIHCLPTGKHIWRGNRQATRSPDARNGVQIDGAATRRGKLIFIIFGRITCKKRT